MALVFALVNNNLSIDCNESLKILTRKRTLY